MFQRDKVYKRWGPQFVIIENSNTKKRRPHIDSRTKVLQFNTGTPDRIPPYSYSYNKNGIHINRGLKMNNLQKTVEKKEGNMYAIENNKDGNVVNKSAE